MAGALTVTARLVTAVADNGRVIYLYQGDVVPDGIAEDSLKNLKELGFVGEPQADEPDEDEKPARGRRKTSDD